ncbi:MAG: response regulator transcription factor [Cecembia sp.]
MKQILVIEDDKVIATLLTFKLKKEGYGIKVVSSATEGISIFDKLSPDLLITDLFVPKEQGVEILDYVKKTRPECPVIVLITEGDEERLVQDAMNSGASDHMAKPFHPSELVYKVNNLINN